MGVKPLPLLSKMKTGTCLCPSALFPVVVTQYRQITNPHTLSWGCVSFRLLSDWPIPCCTIDVTMWTTQELRWLFWLCFYFLPIFCCFFKFSHCVTFLLLPCCLQEIQRRQKVVKGCFYPTRRTGSQMRTFSQVVIVWLVRVHEIFSKSPWQLSKTTTGLIRSMSKYFVFQTIKTHFTTKLICEAERCSNQLKLSGKRGLTSSPSVALFDYVLTRWATETSSKYLRHQRWQHCKQLPFSISCSMSSTIRARGNYSAWLFTLFTCQTDTWSWVYCMAASSICIY